ncbi:mitochondrial DNA helicase isoform X2 [Bemisia tabaci]|uniref:mitochondrial DNA helicase isoform X2 n=2 Tax=Bemisia tabaci TaxID=7038 RepID=UPI003B289F61
MWSRKVMDAHDIPNVSVSKMKRFLELNGLGVKDGYACLITSCKFCTSATEDSALFVNKVTGFYQCSNCGISGQWSTLQNQINKKGEGELPKPKHVIKVDPADSKWRELSEKLQNLSSLPPDERSKIIEKFDLKGLSKNVITQLGILVDSEKTTLYFPLKNAQNCVVGFKELNLQDSEITVPSNNCSGVLRLSHPDDEKRTDNPKQAIIVHSLKDLVALSAYSLPYDKICLPHGLLSLPQELLPLLEQYKKIVLWFGNDTASWDSAKNFAKKLDERRCYFVRPIESQPAPHIAHKNELNFSEIVKSSQPICPDSVTTFSSLREELLAELQNKNNTQGVKWKRFPGLNNILKGHRRGELSILTGPTGCGKTTLMSELSLDLAMQGVTTLWGSFEIKNHRLARTMLQQYCMLPLEQNLKDFEFWADQFEKLPLYFLTFHGQQNLQVVMEAVEHVTYVYDIAHVIIDNVQFMLGLGEKENMYIDRFYRQDLIIAAFRSFATKRNCHVTLVIHPRKEREGEQLSANSIFGSAKASQEADNVFIIQHKQHSQTAELNKYLQVAKNRFCGDLGIVPLQFHKDSRSFSKSKEKAEGEEF